MDSFIALSFLAGVSLFVVLALFAAVRRGPYQQPQRMAGSKLANVVQVTVLPSPTGNAPIEDPQAESEPMREAA